MTLHPSDGAHAPVSLVDEELVRDPFTAYARVRESGTLVRGLIPGADPVWLVTRYDDVRLVLTDPRFVSDVTAVPGQAVPDVVEQIRAATGIAPEYLDHLRRGLGDVDGADHTRLRRLVSRAFTARRVAELRPRVEEIAERLLDRLPEAAENGVVDLLRHFAYPLPIAVICELVGIPEQDRGRWREWSAALAAGLGPGMEPALRGLADHTRELIGRRRAEPADDLITELVRVHDEDGDRLDETELVTMVISLVLAGHETTAHLIANGTAALLTHPGQLAALRRNPELTPRAVHELMRWCGPVLATRMRYPTEDVRIADTLVRRGEPVLPVLAGGNRDPRAYQDPDRLDITRDPGGRRETHLGFGQGRHYCLGAALARQEAEVAFTALLRRFPGLRLAVTADDLRHGPNPGAWHLASVPVRLQG
ncbi:cytochrome P450 family protein [Marinactinospora rubrisoli]|uniref:Cytochrome P450 n=1 Tax=Marinactinospora rubrisoli TaxID=2715399 RepID=A0ABW2KNA3_9ACTN